VTGAPELPAGTTRGRRLAVVGFVGYAVVLAWILLWPSADIATWVVEHVAGALSGLGSSDGLVTGSRVEFALNALMVAPLLVLAALLWPRVGWERWTAYAFVASCTVELTQGLMLPMRSAQLADVVSNTLGAGAGAILGHLVLQRNAHRGPSDAREPSNPD
jgi:glycopeptide antibiotics resistance protein